jgi:putative oxidoreductase
VVGIVFLVHGGQKLFLLGFGGVAEFFGQLGIPPPLFFAVVVTLVEFVGGAVLILGLFTRLVAIPLAIEMLVATLLVHLPNGFSVANGGYEFTLVLLAASVALVLASPGEAALDKILAARVSSTLARLLR